MGWYDYFLSCPHLFSESSLDWALPDQLVFSTISALLRVSSSYPQYCESTMNAITNFISKVANLIQDEARASRGLVFNEVQF